MCLIRLQQLSLTLNSYHFWSNHMNYPIQTALAPPNDLAFMFDDPPLVGNEKREDYDRFLRAIAEAVNPVDKIVWILVLDITDLCWEIRRERRVKADIIKSAQIAVINEILKLITADQSGMSIIVKIFNNGTGGIEGRRWASDPQAREEIESLLTKNSYSAASILAQAFVLAADDIDAVDRRIASYELRRMAVLRQAELRSEKLFRQLEKASNEVLEGELSDVLEAQP
jgi:hypothetical protein